MLTLGCSAVALAWAVKPLLTLRVAAVIVLPLTAACLFTVFLDTKNDVLLKAVLTVAQVMWAVYDFSIRNYAFFVFDILTILSNLIGIFLLIRKGGSLTKALPKEQADARAEAK